MTDKKQVMFDIERCICHVPDACRDCSKYKGVDELRCMEELMADAYALLKEQEAKIRQLRLALQIMNGNGIIVDTKGR